MDNLKINSNQKTSKLAIWSLVLSISPFLLSAIAVLIWFWNYGRTTFAPNFSFLIFLGLIILIPLASMLATIFGIIAIINMNKNRNLKGKGLAIAGIIIGVIPILPMISVAISYFLSKILSQ